MTNAAARKNLKNRGQVRSTGAKPKGKGYLSLTEYKRAKRAEIDRFRKECGA